MIIEDLLELVSGHLAADQALAYLDRVPVEDLVELATDSMSARVNSSCRGTAVPPRARPLAPGSFWLQAMVVMPNLPDLGHSQAQPTQPEQTQRPGR